MTVPPGLAAALADRYQLERELGAGGMATVYLAQDLRHDRKVAVKVLRPELAAVIGAERFLSEIKTTANLQHPHILPLFDSGAAGPQGGAAGTSFLFYVMPYVDGESLRDRLNREKQLPIGEAVRIAKEVASALDYAHRHGVIHRDIKPENVMLHDGSALVADFGIALAASKAGSTRMTETGMSLGTPSYMSPEQAMGEREITARSDVYALGAMTYEMLVGDPPFMGSTAQAIVAKVLTEKPVPPSRSRDTVPESVDATVLMALAKLPADRFATAAEFATSLTGMAPTLVRPGVSLHGSPSPRGRLVLAAMALLLLLAGAMIGRALAPAARSAGPMIRATMDLGDSTSILSLGNLRLAISPDGKRVAFAGSHGTNTGLWVREMDQPEARFLADTRGAFAPFFSPDGGFLGFFTAAGGRVSLRIVPVSGGVVRTLVQDSVASFGGADWGDDGQIYFTNSGRGLSRIAASGGAIAVIGTPDSVNGIKEYDYPDVLPGSKQAFLMLWKGSIGSNRIGVIDLASGEVTELADGSFARVLSPGHIAIGAADGRLLVAPYDAGKRRLAETPVLLLDDVEEEISNGTVQFAIADNGTLVYQRKTGGDVRVLWVDRTGARSPVDATFQGSFSSAALSPDAHRIAVAVSVAGGGQVWIKDLRTGAFTPISQGLADADRPVWFPDGRSVGFLATRNTHRTAWLRRADGSDSARAIAGTARDYDEVSFPPGGRFTLFRSEGSAQGTRHLLVMENGVDSVPRPLLQSRYDTYAMTLSPDGRWLAYVSDESGASEVYVRPFPNVDSAKFAISSGGALEPLWRRDGAELFFRNRTGDMYSVAVDPGAEFQFSAPRLLFTGQGLTLQDFYRSYDIHPDGRRFLMLEGGAADVGRLSVILNWRPELLTATEARRE